MKNIKYLSVVFLIGFILQISSAQSQWTPGSYKTNSNIDKFVGTWQWTSGSDVLTIKFVKIKYLNPSDYYEDLLFGCHEYIQNGTVVESSMANFNLLSPIKKGSITLYNDLDLGVNNATGTIRDITKKKDGHLMLEYIAGTPPQLQWTLKTYEGGTINTPYGLTLPRTLILTKQ